MTHGFFLDSTFELLQTENIDIINDYTWNSILSNLENGGLCSMTDFDSIGLPSSINVDWENHKTRDIHSYNEGSNGIFDFYTPHIQYSNPLASDYSFPVNICSNPEVFNLESSNFPTRYHIEQEMCTPALSSPVYTQFSPEFSQIFNSPEIQFDITSPNNIQNSPNLPLINIPNIHINPASETYSPTKSVIVPPQSSSMATTSETASSQKLYSLSPPPSPPCIKHEVNNSNADFKIIPREERFPFQVRSSARSKVRKVRRAKRGRPQGIACKPCLCNDAHKHSVERKDKFVCHICHNYFCRKPDLTRHLKDNKIECCVKGCDKLFSRKDNMRTHVKKCHA
ncbi:hypothetical protein HK096_006017 [Nowakowskiella sp. JEL0078]|nr:hypothetical protein HK096_006017 [Nowakowskiella sp. JEL0078]